jgi:hypothetical protein
MLCVKYDKSDYFQDISNRPHITRMQLLAEWKKITTKKTNNIIHLNGLKGEIQEAGNRAK